MTVRPGRITAVLGVIAASFFLIALLYRQPAIPTNSAQFAAGAIPAIAKRQPTPGITYAIDSVEVAGVQHPIPDPTPIHAGEAIIVHGWAVVPESLSPGKRLFVSVDRAPAQPVTAYGGARPDVAAAVNPAAENSGFAATIATSGLRPGNHRLSFALENADGVLVALPTLVQFTLN